MGKKKMCKWRKIDRKLDEFRDAVLDPRYACKSCGRVAHDKKRLCKPILLSD